MWLKKLKVLLILPLLYFVSCSFFSNQLLVAFRNFEDVIDVQQNLQLQFSHDLVDDSLLGVWLDIPYIKFTPEVKGKFKWTDNDELIFSPDFRFAASTDYKAELTNALLKHRGSKESLNIPSDETSINFHTAYLNLDNINSFWSKKDAGENEVKMELRFNYKVDPSQLKKLLRLNINNEECRYELNSSSVSNAVEISVTEGFKSLDNANLKITIEQGLKCIESNYVSKDPIVLEGTIPDKSNFQITGIEVLYDNDIPYLNIGTNQEPANQDFVSKITIKPELSLTAEKHESGFRLRGKFKIGETYELTIDKSLKGIFGGTLSENFSHSTFIVEQKPHISFVSKNGVYLTSKGQKNVGIRIINIPKIKVSVYKVYENNMLSFFRENGMNSYDYYYEDEYGGDYYYGNSDYYGIDNYGDLIMEKEYESKTLRKEDGSHHLNLNFDDINASYKGIYVVRVESTQDRWMKSAKVISISDIGMIVKQADDNIYVFTNSILTTEALPKTNVTLVSSNNQAILKAETNSQGLAVFENVSKKAPGFRIQMVTSQLGGDFNYVHFNQNKVGTAQYEVGGTFTNLSGYDAFLYGDREIYRPGETIYLNTIVRNEKWQPLSNVPIKIKLILPNGKEFSSQKGTLNNEGAYDTKFSLPVSTVTGTYVAEVYTANDVLLNSKNISVEEFMPDRIKVNASVNKEKLSLIEPLVVNATALNMFGPPASNRNYEVEMTLRRKFFSPKGLSDYNFSIQGNSYNKFENVLREGSTNEQGVLTETFTFNQDFQNNGMLEGRAYVTVFDETGRPVNRVKSFELATQDVFYGIKYFDYYVSTKSNLNIPLIAVNKEGKTVGGNAHVQIIRYTWQTVLQKNEYGSYRYISQRKQQIMLDKIVSLGTSVGNVSFLPSVSGEYEIRVKKPGVNSYVSQGFYAYGWGSTENSSFEVSTEGNITIELDKENYQVGEKANILFKTPFEGKILVTVERKGMLEHHYITTDKKSAMFTLDVKEAFIPNVYISATLIRPNPDNSMPLTVAHGYQPLFAEQNSNKLPLQIISVEKSRSNTQQKICIKSKPASDIQVTLAVVDEGILQLKDTETPDPYAFFFRKRALEVKSYDIYNKLLPELITYKSSPGGDGYNLEKRVNPLTNKRVKLMAYWSGILHTNAEGEACYTIDIPRFSGDLRLMAVAYKGSSFGSAEKNMKIADPVVVSTALPRFLSPRDTMIVPVTMTNTTANTASGEAKITVNGPLVVVGPASKPISIAPNSETVVEFKVYAKSSIGTANVITSVNTFNENFDEEIEITVRPPSSLIKKSGSGQVAANTTKKLDMMTNFIPTTVTGKLVISKSPVIQFADNLDYLVGYPHGCVEQTVSKAFPQIYFSDLIKSMGIKNNSGSDPAYNVNEAINKLTTMQLYNGGMSYWPGGYDDNWWGTAYATHFLYEARSAGYEVDIELLEKLYGYLRKKVKEKNYIDYYYYDNNAMYKTKRIAPKEVFYSLYILAKVGKKETATMNYWKSNTDKMALDSRYLLASTYYMLGDKASYQQVLPTAFDNEKSINAFGGSFYSYIRDMSIVLNTMIDTDPTNPQVGVLSQQLSLELKNKRWLSTQERAFAFIALGKIAKKANESNITADIKVNGGSIGSYTGGVLKFEKNIANQTVEITTKGNGQLYYYWSAEGLSSDGKVLEEDSYIRVRKTFYDRKGNIITGNSFRQNDLIVVKINVYTTNNTFVDNVVITDILPAGFEIENPRLTQIAGMDWLKEPANPEHFDIRDDRINMFTSVNGNPRNYYYMVRAVSPGTYVMGPVSADAMYNGEYHSYNGAGTIRISRK